MSNVLYNPGNTNLLIDGNTQTDFAPDTEMWTLVKRNDFNETIADALGNTITTENLDNIHELTVNYNAGSTDLRRILKKGYERGRFQITLVDSNNDTAIRVTDSDCVMMKPGDTPRGPKAPLRTIVFTLPNPTFDFQEQ